LRIETSYYGIDAQGKETTGNNTALRSKQEDAKLDSLYLKMKKNYLTSKILSVDEKTAVVNVTGSGDDLLFNHHFIRVGNCWFQNFIENYSL